MKDYQPYIQAWQERFKGRRWRYQTDEKSVPPFDQRN